jgi:uncharacterized protein
MSDTPTTEESMDETLKELERQLGEGEKLEDQSPSNAPQSAEILNLAEAAGDGRKNRSQNRSKTAAGPEQASPSAEAVSREAGQPAAFDVNVIARAASPAGPGPVQRQPQGGATGTLEGVMCELIRPVLQNWVDQKLGGIVDELVKAEIAKALEQAGVL